jgi:hypothetical protein
MRCYRIKQYDKSIVKEERTCEYFLSGRDLIHGGVVSTASPRCLAPLLIQHECHNSWRVALLYRATNIGEVANFPTVEARLYSWCRLLRWHEGTAAAVAGTADIVGDGPTAAAEDGAAAPRVACKSGGTFVGHP